MSQAARQSLSISGDKVPIFVACRCTHKPQVGMMTSLDFARFLQLFGAPDSLVIKWWRCHRTCKDTVAITAQMIRSAT